MLMGLALGMAASLGGFFLLGTIDRRAYGASQLGLGSNLPPCLGVLPDLGASLNDPHTSDIASHCVHQIRNQIEAVREPSAGYVLAVSSPFQGDGKTSIVMALGWSYAAAGYNTLLIDCDMVGRSLTRQLGLTGREGVKEALVAKELNGAVARLPWANLSAVPVGVDARFGPANVRRIDLDTLVGQVRGQYDIIIVDTGPLLGSLESTPVMAVADGVVLSVRRGRSRGKLEECVARLKLVGTQCVGVILNCAARSDCNRYVSEASLAAAEEERLGRGALVKGAAPTAAPGERNALVRAVQTTTRERQRDDAPETGLHG
jgi:Mrp family chromosome partitioning ATPase